MLAFLLTLGWLWAQDAQPKLQFDVASIRLNTVDGPVGDSPVRSGDRIAFHNADLPAMVVYAWGIDARYQLSDKDYQTLNNGASYDIEAKTTGAVSDVQLKEMFRHLLEERFHLQAHREMRDGPVYDLLVVKAGRMKETPAEEKAGGSAGFRAANDGLHLVGSSAGIAQLIGAITGQLHSPVHDVTGLSGTYNFDIRLEDRNGHVPGADAAAPSLEAALERELGLKLVKKKGMVEVLVIDHVEKPGPN